MTSIAKEFHRLLKKINRLTDGQASIEDVNWDESELQNFNVTIRPNDGFYKGGKFVFTVTVPSCYPSELPPSVWCQTDIYHPNIDPTDERWDEGSTNVCLNLFEAGMWNPSFGLEGLVHGLVFLMHNPNILDPLSPYFEEYSEEDFAENVKKYMAGERVQDHDFNVDFVTKQGAEVEHETKDNTNTTDQCDDSVENSRETNEAESIISIEEKSDADDTTEAKDTTQDQTADTCIPNDAEGLKDDTKDSAVEFQMENVVTDTQEQNDRLHNERNEKENTISEDVCMQDIYNIDDDSEENTSALVFDGECMFVPWTNCDDTDVAMDTGDANAGDDGCAGADEGECMNGADNTRPSTGARLLDIIRTLFRRVHHRCTCVSDNRTNVQTIDSVDGRASEHCSLISQTRSCDLGTPHMAHQRQSRVYPTIRRHIWLMNLKQQTGGDVRLMLFRVVLFMYDCSL